MTENKILETWLKWLRKGEWYEVTDDIERLLLEPKRGICWCGVSLPNREWIGLTDDERRFFNNRGLPSGLLIEAIESRLRNKNT